MLQKRIFISGGKKSLKSWKMPYDRNVEAFDANGIDSVFKFPFLPDIRVDHCMVVNNDRQLMVCGGLVIPHRFKSDKECLILDGTWKFHSYLTKNRIGAIGITMPNGIYIFGGRHSPMTSDFLAKGSCTWVVGPEIPTDSSVDTEFKSLPANCKYDVYGEAVSSEELILITTFILKGELTTDRVFSVRKFNVITQEWTYREEKILLGYSCKSVLNSVCRVCPKSTFCTIIDKVIPGFRAKKNHQVGVIRIKEKQKILAFRDKQCVKEWDDAKKDWKSIPEPKCTRTSIGFCSLLNTKLE